MKSLCPVLKIAPGLLVLALLVTPVSLPAADATTDKTLTKTEEKIDTGSVGRLSDGEKTKAKEDTADKATQAREEDLKKALEKYDANHNGKLDGDELKKMKADEAKAKHIEATEERMERRSTKRINDSVRRATKVPKVK